MGRKLTWSEDYLLSLNTLVWAESKRIPHGHFAFAIRKRGGAADSDTVFDFRAPWELDRRTEPRDVFGEEMLLRSYSENYYDWLWTHTARRHCGVVSSFVRICEEQIILLQAYRGKIHDVRQYELLKGNCASIGLQVLNRILPLDKRLPRENSIMDLPVRKIRIAEDAFGGVVAVVEHQSTTLQQGRQLTHKNQTLPAEPDRRTSLPFRNLLKVKEIN